MKDRETEILDQIDRERIKRKRKKENQVQSDYNLRKRNKIV
jgi:hypothetical protein